MVNRPLALLLTVALALPGCAMASGPRLQSSGRDPRVQPDRTLIAEFAQKLPAGSRVRVRLIDGSREHGTLMDATAERLVIQRRTRIPEPPIQLPLDRVMSVELENGNGSSIVKAAGVGIAAGAGAIAGILLILAAIYAD